MEEAGLAPMARKRSERVLSGRLVEEYSEVVPCGVEGTTMVGMLREADGNEAWVANGRDESMGEAGAGMPANGACAFEDSAGSAMLEARTMSSSCARRRLTG